MKKYNSKKSGFSLIELSVVIAIAAVMIGSGVMIATEYSNKSRVDQTREKMEEIMKYIKRYYTRYGVLPCPADGTADLGSAGFGQPTACAAATAYRGVLPTTALGLHYNYMFDAWGNRFTYFVEHNISHTSCTAPTTSLAMQNYFGDLYSTPGTGSRIAVSLVSHGENGALAYSGRSGSINAASAIPAETNNGSSLTPHSSIPINGYDDLVYMYSWGQIIDFTKNGSYGASGCSTLATTVNNEGFIYGK